MFIESDVEHPSIIINNKICNLALEECKRQKVIPFEKQLDKNDDKTNEPNVKEEKISEGTPSRSLDKYDNIIKKSDNINIKIIKEKNKTSEMLTTTEK